MKIVHERPPEWIMQGCLSQFRINVDHTYWTYGDTIYNPGGQVLPDHLIAHEATHMRQQAAYEDTIPVLMTKEEEAEGKMPHSVTIGGPDAWWKRYFVDPEFRYQQELEAYAMQYAFYCSVRADRNDRFRFLMSLGRSLSGPLYQLPVSFLDAQMSIRELAESVRLPAP